ncbi:MAG: branched-chain amino acid transaminase [Thermoplasmata archaeon]
MADSKENIKVWWDGKIKPFNEAKVPILNHSMQYGSGIFEGIRAYETPKGPSIFRLKEHVRRFFRSAKIYDIEIKYSQEEVIDAIKEIVRENGFRNCYIRPFIFYYDDNIQLPTEGKKTSLYIVPFPLANYIENSSGIKCKISSWVRIDSYVLPVQAKASGNYINSLLAIKEAKASGFDEAIMMDRDGYVAEGSAENIFIVKDGIIMTPSMDSSILEGITRDSLISISEKYGFKVKERKIHREELITADEVFICGTAAEVTPVKNIDGIKIGDGKEGKVTKILREKYFNAVRGRDQNFEEWMEYV